MLEDEIIKVCKYHGTRTKEQIYLQPYKKKIFKRCKECLKSKNARYQERKNLDPEFVAKRKERERLRWLKDKEKITAKRKQPERLQSRRDSYKKNAENHRKIDKEKQIKYRENLSDPYIRRMLEEHFDIDKEYITSELIDIKRLTIKLKRLARVR